MFSLTCACCSGELYMCAKYNGCDGLLTRTSVYGIQNSVLVLPVPVPESIASRGAKESFRGAHSKPHTRKNPGHIPAQGQFFLWGGADPLLPAMRPSIATRPTSDTGR